MLSLCPLGACVIVLPIYLLLLLSVAREPAIHSVPQSHADVDFYILLFPDFFSVLHLSTIRFRSSSMTMSYYEPQGWQAPAARQVPWEQPVPPSRSGRSSSSCRQSDASFLFSCSSPGSSSVSQREDIPAFSSQFDGMPSDPRVSSTYKRTSPAVARGGHKENQKS